MTNPTPKPFNPLKIILPIVVIFTMIIAYGIYRRKQNPEVIPTWAAHDEQVDQLGLKLKTLSNEIKGLQGNSRCTKDDQCRVVGLGSRVCNGYQDFLIYSVNDTDETTLLQKVRAFNSTMNQINNLSIKVPNCGQSPATIQCRSYQCVPVVGN